MISQVGWRKCHVVVSVAWRCSRTDVWSVLLSRNAPRTDILLVHEHAFVFIVFLPVFLDLLSLPGLLVAVDGILLCSDTNFVVVCNCCLSWWCGLRA